MVWRRTTRQQGKRGEREIETERSTAANTRTNRACRALFDSAMCVHDAHHRRVHITSQLVLLLLPLLLIINVAITVLTIVVLLYTITVHLADSTAIKAKCFMFVQFIYACIHGSRCVYAGVSLCIRL